MPAVEWGIGAEDVDDFDRSKQYTPYMGKTPPNAVYFWEIKRLTYTAGTREKNPQLCVGLELVSRDKSEQKYEGYYITDWIPVMNKTQFRYVPLLDALGISGKDFANKTIVDGEGNVVRIGSWHLDRDMVAARLKDGVDKDGNPRKEIGGYFEVPELEADEDDEELSEEDYDEEDEEEYDEDDDGF